LNPELTKQEYEQIDDLNTLSQEVISRQATINIGTIGHVAHGKSTVVRAISGVQTVRSLMEKRRGITIQLGYANAKIFKCPKCPAPNCYSSTGSNHKDDAKCRHCKSPIKLIRHVSFVDCPGHDVLMSRMLTGTAVMDACLLLVAGNKKCPQPQTSEHLAGVEIMQMNNIIILQNKIDLIYEDTPKSMENFNQIKQFVKGTRAEFSPIIPISA